MRRRWILPTVLVGVLAAASCQPTPAPPPAPFSSIAAWQSTTWAWAKLVRVVGGVNDDGMLIRESDSGSIVPVLTATLMSVADEPWRPSVINPNNQETLTHSARRVGSGVSYLLRDDGVGVAGFEPTASSSRTKRATKLRHTPVAWASLADAGAVPPLSFGRRSAHEQVRGVSVSSVASGRQPKRIGE